jgi:signal transduction histidine kinase
MANRNLLSALAGPGVALAVEAEGGALPVRISGEDLTRILVNLVKNASESMAGTGRIQIVLSERTGILGKPGWLHLAIEDSGPGIPSNALETIFASGYTTHPGGGASHRGLGLSITRSIVEAAGGRIAAANRGNGGACFEIELPVTRT